MPDLRDRVHTLQHTRLVIRGDREAHFPPFSVPKTSLYFFPPSCPHRVCTRRDDKHQTKISPLPLHQHVPDLPRDRAAPAVHGRPLGVVLGHP